MGCGRERCSELAERSGGEGGGGGGAWTTVEVGRSSAHVSRVFLRKLSLQYWHA